MGTRTRLGWFALALVAFVAVASSGLEAESEGAHVLRAAAVRSATPAPPKAVTPEPTAAPVAIPVPVATSAPTPAPTRAPHRWTPFAYVGEVPLIHPSQFVKRVGFHQASDPMNRDMSVAESAQGGTVLPTRHRPTPPRSAADIQVHPRSQIRAPVTGLVKRAGTYDLYCKYPDAFVVISPDGHPELEVKVLHVTGLHVKAGDRIVAAKTLLADHATKFPFASQIDAFTGVAWPHVHIEATQLETPNTTVEPNASLTFGC